MDPVAPDRSVTNKTHDLSKETLGSHISTISNNNFPIFSDRTDRNAFRSNSYLPLITSRTNNQSLVEVNGIEPMTSCLQSTRSTN
jgi:hypothetical protein